MSCHHDLSSAGYTHASVIVLYIDLNRYYYSDVDLTDCERSSELIRGCWRPNSADEIVGQYKYLYISALLAL